MKAKFAIATVLILALTVALSMPAAYAEMQKKTEGRHWGSKDKFSSKAYLIFKNQEELGLSEEQIKKIKDLKLKAKKDSIKAKAEIEIIALDIKAKMWEETVDTAAVNKLVDEKYELMKAKTKSSIAACAELRNILTEEQREKLKGLRKKCKMGKGKPR